jgi:NAD(P)H-nitrite reductase large subunit
MHEEHFICRCEEVTLEEILESIRLGDVTLSAVKKRTRAGMGYCQGKTCSRLIVRLLTEALGKPPEVFFPGSVRMPVGPINIGQIAAVEGAEDGED